MFGWRAQFALVWARRREWKGLETPHSQGGGREWWAYRSGDKGSPNSNDSKETVLITYNWRKGQGRLFICGIFEGPIIDIFRVLRPIKHPFLVTCHIADITFVINSTLFEHYLYLLPLQLYLIGKSGSSHPISLIIACKTEGGNPFEVIL